MYRSFREVYEAAQACQACALAKTRKSVVFGEGSAKSGLMLIGEGRASERIAPAVLLLALPASFWTR